MNLVINKTVIQQTDVKVEDIGIAISKASEHVQAAFFVSMIVETRKWEDRVKYQCDAIANLINSQLRSEAAKFFKTLATSLEAAQ